jgi:small subunit ribosomal protein S6
VVAAFGPLLSRRDRGRVSPEEACKRTVQPSLEQFLNVVTTGGGTVDKVDVWGRRRLAYDIDKKSEGIYTVVDMTAEPDTVKELDRQLNLNEAVLRTKIVRPDK